MLALLRNRNYALLYFGQFCSAIGDQLYGIALFWLAFRLTGSSTAMALVGAAQYIPYLLFGLVGGVLADRFDRRRLMIATDLARMLAVALVPALHVLGILQAWHLGAVAMIQSSAAAFFMPARSALMVAVLPERDYQRGAAAFSATIRTARILGPLLGSFLFARISLEYFFLLDAAAFLVSMLTTAAIRLQAEGNARFPGQSGAGSLLDGLRRIGANRNLASCLIGNGVGMVAWTGLYSIGMVLVAEERIGGGEVTYSMLVTAYGVGNVLANLVVGNLPVRNRTAWIFGGWLPFALGYLVLGFTTDLRMGLAAIAFAAIGGPVMDLGMSLKIRAEVDPRDLGKAYALWYTGSFGGSALGVLLFGPLFDRWSIPEGFVLGSAWLAALGLAGMLGLARGEKAASEESAAV